MQSSVRPQPERPVAPGGDITDFPVREYVAAMSREMAQMARREGDEDLAGALEKAADMAEVAATSVTS